MKLYGNPMNSRSLSGAGVSLGWARLMFDLLMLVLLAAAFVGAVGYVRACERLTDRPNHSDEASR